MCRGVEFVEALSGEVSTVALGRFPQRYTQRTQIYAREPDGEFGLKGEWPPTRK